MAPLWRVGSPSSQGGCTGWSVTPDGLRDGRLGLALGEQPPGDGELFHVEATMHRALMPPFLRRGGRVARQLPVGSRSRGGRPIVVRFREHGVLPGEEAVPGEPVVVHGDGSHVVHPAVGLDQTLVQDGDLFQEGHPKRVLAGEGAVGRRRVDVPRTEQGGVGR